MGVDQMESVVQKEAVNGCIKSVKGSWLVHRKTKDGRVTTRYRFPSKQERQRNAERERKRRCVARNIFSGLRAFGNYKLPKNADTIDLLKALSDEAGWHVQQDGTIHKKEKVVFDGGSCYNSYESRVVSPDMDGKDHNNIDLKLSLTLASYCI